MHKRLTKIFPRDSIVLSLSLTASHAEGDRFDLPADGTKSPSGWHQEISSYSLGSAPSKRYH